MSRCKVNLQKSIDFLNTITNQLHVLKEITKRQVKPGN